jgi:transposase
MRVRFAQGVQSPCNFSAQGARSIIIAKHRHAVDSDPAGPPPRDLPEAFGKWNSVRGRFRRWALKSAFERLFEVLSRDPDFECASIDGAVVQRPKERAS